MVQTDLGGQVQADPLQAQEPGKQGNLIPQKQKTEEIFCDLEVHE